jgi:hypothetical protein
MFEVCFTPGVVLWWLGECRAVFYLLFVWVMLKIFVVIIIVIIIGEWGPVICSINVCVN